MTPGPPPVPQSFSRILIVKPSSLGDVVHTLPSARALKKALPDAEIRWIVNTEWAPLLAGNPDLAEVIEFPRSRFRGLGRTGDLLRWLRGLARLKPDLALDFQGLFRSAVFARASGARRIHCLSNAEFLNRWSAHRVVPMRRDEHAVDRYLRMVSDLGFNIQRPVEFPMPAGERPARFASDAPYVLLHPFSRGEGKSLSPEVVRDLCERLAPASVVIAGRAPVTLAPLPNVLNLLNETSLSGLIWLIRNARFVLSVDSGPMHIAAAITPRLLSIHTWSDPRLVGPYEPQAWIWKGGEIFRKKDLTETRATVDQQFELRHLAPLVDFLKKVFSE